MVQVSGSSSRWCVGWEKDWKTGKQLSNPQICFFGSSFCAAPWNWFWTVVNCKTQCQLLISDIGDLLMVKIGVGNRWENSFAFEKRGWGHIVSICCDWSASLLSDLQQKFTRELSKMRSRLSWQPDQRHPFWVPGPPGSHCAWSCIEQPTSPFSKTHWTINVLLDNLRRLLSPAWFGNSFARQTSCYKMVFWGKPFEAWLVNV